LPNISTNPPGASGPKVILPETARYFKVQFSGIAAGTQHSTQGCYEGGNLAHDLCPEGTNLLGVEPPQ
jgi:hypothetical protein